MNTDNIFYGKDFVSQYKSLPKKIQDIATKKENIFKDNPFHPSLRMHTLKGRLSGLMSISITLNYRIIFEIKKNGDIIFISVGKHDIYKSL